MLTLNFEKFPTIETERLLLRDHFLSDAEALFEMRKDERVMKYIPRDRPQEISEVIALIETIKSNFERGETLAWVISLKENPDVLIGSIGYWRTFLENHRAEVGYTLHPDYWKMGIVSEALEAVLNFGFENIKLHSVQANIDPENEASRRLLLKHGFVKEAYFKEDYYYKGKFLDSEIYSRLTNKSFDLESKF